jgi:hypothetical protein
LQQVAKNIEGCYKFFYFHILLSPNLAKFVLWMITTWATSQNWKKKTLPASDIDSTKVALNDKVPKRDL